ncbi:MAG TPA: glutamine amidotransferase [Gammaproteobacteria bacterium]|nr:glutamine amidotransferase [Gammaproteobacteria bacterium]
MKSEPQILTVVHQETSTPGFLGRNLNRRGYSLDQYCPCLGDNLPGNLSEYHGVVIFGGPQSATDDDVAGIRAELDWLEAVALPSKLPLLGICLGAQQLARVLGANVGPRGDGIVEIGYWPVAPTAQGSDFLPETTTFYQWHSETFEIPSGAIHLAESDSFSGQAFSYADHAFGIEFHPEITRDMVNHWCTSERGSPKLKLPGAQPHDAQLVSHSQCAGNARVWLDHFLDNYFFSFPAVKAL